MSCKCMECGRQYMIDFNLPDELWNYITPEFNDGAGLLCPTCITKRLESTYAGYGVFNLTKGGE